MAGSRRCEWYREVTSESMCTAKSARLKQPATTTPQRVAALGLTISPRNSTDTIPPPTTLRTRTTSNRKE